MSRTEMPDFVRRAIEAQGRVDPDEVAAALEQEDFVDETPEHEALRDQPAPEPHWQERDA